MLGRLRKLRFVRAAAVAVVLISAAAWAGKKSFVMPEAKPAVTYKAHDAHTNESVTVAVDPYDTADKANIFSIKYRELGFLPILLVITNDGDQTISLADMKAEFITGDRSKMTPADEDDIYRRVSHPSASASQSPLPIPTKKVKGVVSAQAVEEIRDSRFAAMAVEPHTTHVGFLFFDVSGISSPLAGAHFYLTGVRDVKGNELMYFEIPLEK